MREALQWMGVDDTTLMDPHDETYLDSLVDLPMNFVPTYFLNHFNGTRDANLHVMSYLLTVPTLCDKPIALKVMFVHSLAGDSVT
ncbi:hypothetical protein AMTR_s00086p00142870 [Amborella trichopoda]|uniref:Uncharacterized protein n=1 Tax=Amborella trichopoda TaxID=13333 RepID=W1P5G2_AMBTC|nr:hypothetical protein AMTR_s00086p00142870 [Amborella trichopoda]